MISEKRVKLMTKLAVFEQNESRDVFRANSYLKSDYVILHVLYSLIFSTVAFFLAAIVAVIFKYNDILSHIHNTNIVKTAYMIVGAWICTELIFGAIAYVFYRRRYKCYREKILKYVEDINTLEQIK